MLISANGTAQDFFNTFILIYKSTLSNEAKYILWGCVFFTIFHLIFGNKKERLFFSIQTIILVLIIFNKTIMFTASNKFGLSQRYYRIVWILPVMLIWSYTLVKIFWFKDKKLLKLIGCVALLPVLWYGSQTVIAMTATTYSGMNPNPGMLAVDNIYKIENDVKYAADAITFDKGTSDQATYVAFDYEMWLEIRMYDASVISVLNYPTPYRPSTDQTSLDEAVSNNDYNTILKLLVASNGYNGDYSAYTIDESVVKDALKQQSVEYLICYKYNPNIQIFLNTMSMIGETDNYYILKNTQ